ncbi:hypothetical protein AOLI_G00024460 [Acnodon oligacanthus]
MRLCQSRALLQTFCATHCGRYGLWRESRGALLVSHGNRVALRGSAGSKVLTSISNAIFTFNLIPLSPSLSILAFRLSPGALTRHQRAEWNSSIQQLEAGCCS